MKNERNGIDCSLLRLIFDSSPQGVLVIHNGKVMYSNTALAGAIGFKPGQAIGMDIKELAIVLDPDNSEDIVKRIQALSSGKVTSDKDRFHTKGPDGQKLVLEITASYLELDKKKYVLAYAVDVTSDELSKDTLAAERKAYSVVAEAALSTEEIPELCNQILGGLVETLGFDLGTIRLY
ncbi:MAG: PAS domain S-box protein, partial [Promethearchaeota archaeon]